MGDKIYIYPLLQGANNKLLRKLSFSKDGNVKANKSTRVLRWVVEFSMLMLGLAAALLIYYLCMLVSSGGTQ